MTKNSNAKKSKNKPLSKQKHLIAMQIFAVVIYLSSFVFPQQVYTQTPAEVTKLIANVSESLENPIEDSTQIVNQMHQAVRLSRKVENKQFLASSYKNLAKWHLGNPSIDSTKWYLDQVTIIYNTNKTQLKLADTYLLYEEMYSLGTKFSKANSYAFKALEIYENNNNTTGTAESFLRLSKLFFNNEDPKGAQEYANKAIHLLTGTEDYEKLAKAYKYLADFEIANNDIEKALKTIDKSLSILKENNSTSIQILDSRNTRGNVLKYLQRYDDALQAYTANLEVLKNKNDPRLEIASNNNIGHIHNLKKEYTLAIPYLLKAAALMKKHGNTINLWESYLHLSEAYEETGDFKKALQFQKLLTQEDEAYYESIISRQKDELQVKYETTKKEETITEQQQKIDRQQKTQLLYIGLTVLFAILLLFMYFSFKTIHKKRKKLGLLNSQLKLKSTSLEDTNKTLQNTITSLKSAQSQLIHAEKMASLGELTAGIAHEIQNPLNFVNNFAEVSKELLDEMHEELENGDLNEVKGIMMDVTKNLEKINFHGKRAEGIVKGMLQHSRTGSGKKEPTDINKLTDEYLRLAYHGLRAKDKSFNTKLNMDFDESIGEIQVIPQDIGRVILNLITNAFYAVDEKKKANHSNYEPLVSVSTLKRDHHIVISVKDNGNGIPKHVIEKMFQPFFTTKPTGKGTGLGLSMSYDIIKGHGGTITVESEEQIGTLMKITIPLVT